MVRASVYLVGCRGLARLRGEWAVTVRAAVAEELPDIADFSDHVEIEVGDNQFVLVAAGLSDDLSPRSAEITLSVEFADAPRLLHAYAIDGADKVSIGDGMRGLLQLPQIFG